MKRWSHIDTVKQIESKNIMDEQLNKRKKRLEVNKTIDIKKSLILILRGVISAFVLTAFEYANRNSEVVGILRTIFTIGYFVSLLAILQLPFGLYQLINGIFINNLKK